MKDFPKLHSPFVREQTKDGYLCTNKIDPDLEWVFGHDVIAVDKLDGTNVAVNIYEGKIHSVQNRKNVKEIWSIKQDGWNSFCREGLNNSIRKGYLKSLEDGVHYGELIGPRINGNRHKLDNYYWIPFSYLKKKCSWRSWRENKYPKDFESIKEWFRDLPSLFNMKRGQDIKAEGLVFHHKDGRMAKLRRDMFKY